MYPLAFSFSSDQEKGKEARSGKTVKKIISPAVLWLPSIQFVKMLNVAYPGILAGTSKNHCLRVKFSMTFIIEIATPNRIEKARVRLFIIF